MATIDTSNIFQGMQSVAGKILNEKNLVPAALTGLTLGGFTYVALKGKTIAKARDIVDDIVTGMAGKAIGGLVGDGNAITALGMFIPAYAEIGNSIAESLIGIAEGGSEADVIAEGDVFMAAAGVAIVATVAVLIMAPEGEGPISGPLNDRIFGGV